MENELKLNVLVVDDNYINRLLINKVMSKWSLVADFAENGYQAVEKIENNTYDVVLMDVHMPQMDGLEATQIIRAKSEPYYQQLPIIALTASMLSAERVDIENAGMNDYILKPFDPKNLFEKLSAYQKSESPLSESPKVAAVDSPRVEVPAFEAPIVEVPAPQAPVFEAPKPQVPAFEAPRVETPVQQTPAVESPNPEAPTFRNPWQESPRTETPKVESPQQESPVPETPKVDSPNPESPVFDNPWPTTPKKEEPKPEKEYAGSSFFRWRF